MKREKRKQVRKACMNCAKSHAACSEDRPCSRCTKRGLPCSDVTRKKRRSYSPTPLDTPEVQEDQDTAQEDQETGQEPILQEVQEQIPYAMPVPLSSYPPQYETAYPLGTEYYPSLSLYPTTSQGVPPYLFRQKQGLEPPFEQGVQFSLQSYRNAEDLLSFKYMNTFKNEDLYYSLPPSQHPSIPIPVIPAAIPIPVPPSPCTKSTLGPPEPNDLPLYFASFPFQSLLPIPVLSSESTFSANNNYIYNHNNNHSIENPPCVVPPGEFPPEGTPSEPLVDITKKQGFVPFQSNFMNPLDSLRITCRYKNIVKPLKVPRSVDVVALKRMVRQRLSLKCDEEQLCMTYVGGRDRISIDDTADLDDFFEVAQQIEVFDKHWPPTPLETKVEEG